MKTATTKQTTNTRRWKSLKEAGEHLNVGDIIGEGTSAQVVIVISKGQETAIHDRIKPFEAFFDWEDVAESRKFRNSMYFLLPQDALDKIISRERRMVYDFCRRTIERRLLDLQNAVRGEKIDHQKLTRSLVGLSDFATTLEAIAETKHLEPANAAD